MVRKLANKFGIQLMVTLFFLFYSVLGMVTIDPDFGWELPLGAYILKHGVPQHDIFSYTMPSYRFVDHEWATHAAIALLFPSIGIAGLAVIFGAIAAASLFIATRNAPGAWRMILIVLLGLFISLFAGIRPQLISLLFFSLITQMILSKSLWMKMRAFIPVMFLIWSNLHGGFVVGLGTLAIFLGHSLNSKKGVNRYDIYYFVLGVVSTLINPYGIRLWQEVFVSILDTRLRFTVNEWMPTILTVDPAIWFYIALTTVYVISGKNEMKGVLKLLFAILFIFGLSSYRNIVLFAVFAAGLSTLGFEQLRKKAIGKALFRKRFQLFHSRLFIFIVFGILIYIPSIQLSKIRQSTETVGYPRKALQFLHANPHEGAMLTMYEWGGYMLWYYPNKKVFVDGRMPSWRQDVKDKPKESPDATREYLEMFRFTRPFGPNIRKYGITSILVKTSFLENEANRKRFEAEMKRNKMKLSYQDKVATLYRTSL